MITPASKFSDFGLQICINFSSIDLACWIKSYSVKCIDDIMIAIANFKLISFLFFIKK